MPIEWTYLQVIAPIVISIAGLMIGLVIGRLIQWNHRRSIRRREADLRDVLVFNEKTPPPGLDTRNTPQLVLGSVVLSDDAFTVAYAALRSLFGGRIGVYEDLMDRARREAVLRVKAKAKEIGANAVFNVRFETSNINQNAGRSGLGSMEVLCYGTALTFKQ